MFKSLLTNYNGQTWWNINASLVKNGTWELSELPPGRSTIGSKWGFVSKYNTEGTVDKRKARLVTKGNNLKLITWKPMLLLYDKILSISLAVENYLNLRQLSFWREILTQIHINQPEGLLLTLIVRKAIYGLKQAGRKWFKNTHKVQTSKQ